MSLETFCSGILKTIVTIVFMVIQALYRGFVFSLYWAWFLVPLGVRSITISQSIGILFVVTFCLMGVTQDLANLSTKVMPKTSEEETLFGKLVNEAVMGLFCTTMLWIVGWVWHLFLA